VDAVRGEILALVVAVLIFIGFYIGARLLRRFVGAELRQRHLQPNVVLLAMRVVYFTLILAGALIGLGILLRSENVALAGVVGATIVASLGVQDILRNYVAGYYLLLERNIRVGDRIEFGGKTGVVTDVRMRVTYLKGDDGALVVVPNAELFNTTVTVFRAPAEVVATAGRPGSPGRAPRTAVPRGPSPPAAAS